jgi:outer membrane protein assembly factor BamB
MTHKHALLAALATTFFANQPATAQDWLNWRGPNQNGTSDETGLPSSVALDAADRTWTVALSGRGTPTIHDGRLYTMGYAGDGKELQELLACMDATTGQPIWQHRFTDFLSDSIYSRYAIGSPTVDAATGHVFCMTTPGLLCCFTRAGKRVWERSLMSEYGRLTFPNGRTGAPLIDGELAIVHAITSGWGPLGPARDRFFAFDKTTGECVWVCTPGGPPTDGSFSMPVVATENGLRLLSAGLGGGNFVCVDARTGDPLWRFPMLKGGINSSALLYGDSVIAIHGRENIDSSKIGRMIENRRGAAPEPGGEKLVHDGSYEIRRNDLCSITS